MVCASVNTQGRTASAGSTEGLLQRTGMAIIIDEVAPQSPWSSHKNKKQALGRDMMRIPSNFRLMAWAGLTRRTAVAGVSHPSRAADEWPTRDITFYVPYAPGGSTDPISRKY